MKYLLIIALYTLTDAYNGAW